MDTMTGIAAGLLAGGSVGALLAYLLVRQARRNTLTEARRSADALLRDTRRDAEKQRRMALLSAREDAEKRRAEMEEELLRRGTESEERDSKLGEREMRLADQEAGQRKVQARLDSRESVVRREQEQMTALREELEGNRDEYVSRLEQVAGLGREEAKKLLLNKLRSEARYEAARIAKEIRDEAREVADRDATRIISLAIE